MRAGAHVCVLCVHVADVLMCLVRAVLSLDTEHIKFKHESYEGDGINSFGEFAEQYNRCPKELLAVVHDSHGAIFPVNVPRKNTGKKNKDHKLMKYARIDTVPDVGMRFRLPPSEETREYVHNTIAVVTYTV